MKVNGAAFRGRGILQKMAFDPEVTRAMATAFDMVCHMFGLHKDTTDPQISSAIANAIVDFAEQGERDPDRLCAKTVEALIRQRDSGEY